MALLPYGGPSVLNPVPLNLHVQLQSVNMFTGNSSFPYVIILEAGRARLGALTGYTTNRKL